MSAHYFEHHPLGILSPKTVKNFWPYGGNQVIKPWQGLVCCDAASNVIYHQIKELNILAFGDRGGSSSNTNYPTAREAHV
jgi:hypothetical protein